MSNGGTAAVRLTAESRSRPWLILFAEGGHHRARVSAELPIEIRLLCRQNQQGGRYARVFVRSVQARARQ
jgi:hypothetical protein